MLGMDESEQESSLYTVGKRTPLLGRKTGSYFTFLLQTGLGARTGCQGPLPHHNFNATTEEWRRAHFASRELENSPDPVFWGFMKQSARRKPGCGMQLPPQLQRWAPELGELRWKPFGRVWVA